MRKFKKIVLLLVTFTCIYSSVTGDTTYSKYNTFGESNRDPKFLMSVSVPPTPCGENNEGYCLPRKKCALNSGTSSGETCAQGFGECCFMTTTCTADNELVDVTDYVTTLKSPEDSDTHCSFRIKKQPNICQISVEFVSFATASANVDGICDQDSFVIRGSITVNEGFTTCGNLNDQILYLSYGTSDTIELTPTVTSVTGTKAYSIMVTQIPCDSSKLVPDYCLQYYNQTRGVVKSLDFPTQQQSNQQYTICAGGKAKQGQITWQRCSDANAANADTFLIRGPLHPGLDVTECDFDRDWIQINGNDRICDFPPLPATLKSEYDPFLLNVHFNTFELPPAPWLAAASTAYDETSCADVGTKYTAFLEGCSWENDPGMCNCITNMAGLALLGLVDLNNTGFCLEYSIA